MYSVLLVAALTTGGDVADCHRRGDCGYGGGGGGSCYGWYNGGCYGSCYGCTGGHGFTFGCHGGGGCWGGCYGGGCYGSGCWGGCYGGCWGGCFGCTGCTGCYGGCVGYSPYYAPGTTIVPSESAPLMMPPAGAPGTTPPGKIETVPQPKPTSSGLLQNNRARVLVDLPADAKLYIDDQLMKTTSEHRTFNTPRLDVTQTYYYELRAEVVRDGKPVTMTKRITLKAGEVVRARFGDMEAAETVSTVNAR
jgi:uncharacterized protein (TIGR03000 family)